MPEKCRLQLPPFLEIVGPSQVGMCNIHPEIYSGFPLTTA